ncbi:hypothetical protein J4573_01195 [Actinomadura barringtoniae]|uniref:Uncharacterized protein n=1 Tax=Actinomadura barringtoniae TaxID=1427535 RepID=A0A939PC09_9ACTN|nr:hypothetical protein [Actinomadura barringtoniae]MBO2445696.1 hypothetical protein [Actinomadura barringtoniae]
MNLRLAGGVVMGAGLDAWLPRQTQPEPGAAVALGPAGAPEADVRQALAQLAGLVRDGGVVAAGAGVDLGAGFRSARLEGARGDQRDAVLAALKALGPDGAGRLGSRAGFLVALFGPSATKRVGSAAGRAVVEGRWDALHLAAAASDVLGPEQLEKVLELRAPDGAELTSGGLASVLGEQLSRVLEPLPGPRRLDLLVDMWTRVSAHHTWLARRARLLASQAKQSREDDLSRRRKELEDDLIVRVARYHLDLGQDEQPALADLARWTPPNQHWVGVLDRLVEDAFAATALLRAAVAVTDHGLVEGLARSKAVLTAADNEVTAHWAARPPRRVQGVTGLPARPTLHVSEICRRLERGIVEPGDATYVEQRLKRGHDYALVVMDQVEEMLSGGFQVPGEAVSDWARSIVKRWRHATGHTTVRPPETWDGGFMWMRRGDWVPEPLSDRPAESETYGDLLWYADLVDAVAQLHGHDAAVHVEGENHWLDRDPPRIGDEPLMPRFDSVNQAVAVAAQLVAFGGTAPRGVRTWLALVEGLRGGTAIAEALRGEFIVPEPIAALDGTTVPGTGLRFEVARNARTLAGWSAYMGNCISGPYYGDLATKGRNALAALYDEAGRIVVNVEIVAAHRSEAAWRVDEIAARFNADPDAALDKRVRAWVAEIPAVRKDEEAADEAALDWDAPAARKGAPRRLVQEIGPKLGPLAERAWDRLVTRDVLLTLKALAGVEESDGALTRLRRMAPEQLLDACRNALDARDLRRLWTLTATRPLAAAVEGLEPDALQRYGQLALLEEEAPLPGSLRKLVRLKAVAPSRSMDVVARRVRAALGVLARENDPALARAVVRRATPEALCALAVTITCRAPETELAQVAPPRIVTMPGYPASELNDEEGPWQRALPAARELGADTEAFWGQVSAHGVRVPAAWVGAGGWPALWGQAHRTR